MEITQEELVRAGLPTDCVSEWLCALQALHGAESTTIWHHISQHLLKPDHPFSLHQFMFRAAWADSPGPHPAWISTPEQRKATNLGDVHMAAVHRESIADPETWWSSVLQSLNICFHNPPSKMLDLSGGPSAARWLPEATLNIAESCFVGRDPDGAAIVWDNVEGIQTMTRRDLRAATSKVAHALRAAGFVPGDAIAIDMPMNHSAVIVYLGIVLSGCVVVSIADSFSAEEIATRLEIANAVGIFTQDVILRDGRRLPLFSRVVAAKAPRAVVLPAVDGELSVELRDGDLSWDSFLALSNNAEFEPFVTEAESTTNILFSSGTTGTPKAIPWTHITPMKAAADGWAHQDIQEGHIVAWPTNLGWMMGPWLIYASLLNGAAIALYSGGPGSRGFARFVQDAEVTMLGVVPSLVKAWRKTGAVRGMDWHRIRCFSSTGEASNPEDMLWLMSRAGYRPVIEYCGGTEIGGGYITGSLQQSQCPATFSTPAIGNAFFLLDENGRPCAHGELALVSPMLGSSNRLLNRNHQSVYFDDMPTGPDGETLRRHGDQVAHLGGGYFRAMGRVDDTMNLGGIKVSSAEIERVSLQIDGVVEAAAIALSPRNGGPSRLVLVVVSDGKTRKELHRELQLKIRNHLNPLFKLHRVEVVSELPRTASNKVMRRVLRQQFRL